MSLSPADLKRLKDAFNEFVKNAPDPHAGLVDEKVYGLKDLAKEVENETEVGKRVLKVLELSAQVEGIDAVVERLTQKPPKP